MANKIMNIDDLKAIKEANKLIRDHHVRVREMITHRITLEEAGLGFQLVANPKEFYQSNH
jgi:threonine dehydrogenase-like Zn-dependent dehydrogenase